MQDQECNRMASLRLFAVASAFVSGCNPAGLPHATTSHDDLADHMFSSAVLPCKMHAPGKFLLVVGVGEPKNQN